MWNNIYSFSQSDNKRFQGKIGKRLFKGKEICNLLSKAAFQEKCFFFFFKRNQLSISDWGAGHRHLELRCWKQFFCTGYAELGCWHSSSVLGALIRSLGARPPHTAPYSILHTSAYGPTTIGRQLWLFLIKKNHHNYEGLAKFHVKQTSEIVLQKLRG